HAPKKQRLAHGLASFRKAAELAVLMTANRRPSAAADGSGMKGRRDPQLDALSPDRVIIVRAVDTETIVVIELGPRGWILFRFRDRAQYVGREHRGLETKDLDGMF